MNIHNNHHLLLFGVVRIKTYDKYQSVIFKQGKSKYRLPYVLSLVSYSKEQCHSHENIGKVIAINFKCVELYKRSTKVMILYSFTPC